MKKVGVSLLIMLLVINSFISVSLVSAQNLPGNLEDIDKTLPVIDKIEEGKEKVANLTADQLKNETTWQYLSRKWKEILLKNKVVSGIDGFFSKKGVSLVFRIIFGEPYSLSFKLFVIIIIWFWFLFIFLKLRKLLPLSGWICLLIAFALVVVFAQIHIISELSKAILWIIFAKKAWWWNLIMATLAIVALLFIYYFSVMISQASEKAKKKAKERKTEQRQKELKGFTDEVRELYTSHGEGD